MDLAGQTWRESVSFAGVAEGKLWLFGWLKPKQTYRENKSGRGGTYRVEALVVGWLVGWSVCRSSCSDVKTGGWREFAHFPVSQHSRHARKQAIEVEMVPR